MAAVVGCRRSDEHGQVQSSLVAVAAVAAVLVGLLVLFGTGGTDAKTADQPPSTTPTPAPVTSEDTPTAEVSTPSPTPSPTPVQSTSVATTRPPVDPTTAKPTATGPRPRIEIYNNTTRHGLADRVADRARAAGWTVAGIDNWRGKVITTTVYYPPGLKDHATALAADLGIGKVKDALSNMKTDRLTVILTTDYAG